MVILDSMVDDFLVRTGPNHRTQSGGPLDFQVLASGDN